MCCKLDITSFGVYKNFADRVHGRDCGPRLRLELGTVQSADLPLQ